MVGAGFVAFPNSFQCACSPLAHQRVCCMMTLFCLAALTMTVMLVAFVCRPCGFISLSLTPPLHFVARWAEAGGGGGFFWSCFGWRRHGQLALGGVVLWGPFCSISRGREGESKEGGEGGKRRGGLPFQRGGFLFFLSFFFLLFLSCLFPAPPCVCVAGCELFACLPTSIFPSTFTSFLPAALRLLLLLLFVAVVVAVVVAGPAQGVCVLAALAVTNCRLDTLWLLPSFFFPAVDACLHIFGVCTLLGHGVFQHQPFSQQQQQKRKKCTTAAAKQVCMAALDAFCL